jgi:hypothetical protein
VRRGNYSHFATRQQEGELRRAGKQSGPVCAPWLRERWRSHLATVHVLGRLGEEPMDTEHAWCGFLPQGLFVSNQTWNSDPDVELWEHHIQYFSRRN